MSFSWLWWLTLTWEPWDMRHDTFRCGIQLDAHNIRHGTAAKLRVTTRSQCADPLWWHIRFAQNCASNDCVWNATKQCLCVLCMRSWCDCAAHWQNVVWPTHRYTHTHSKWRQRGNEAKIWLWWTISHDSLSVDDRRVARWNPFYLQSFFLSASVSLSLYSPLSIVHLSIFNRSSQSLGWSLAHLVSANDYNIVCVIIDTCIEYTFEPGLCETCLRVYDVRCPMINQSRWCARNDLHRCGLWSISLVTGHCAVGIRSWIHSGRRVALQRHSIYIVYISILLLLKIIDREQSVAIFLFHACYARGMPLKPISSHTAHNTNTKNWLQNNEEQ